MHRNELLQAIDSLNTWSRQDERAPHKPLLILLALGELARGMDTVSFAFCETPLKNLLTEFGPARQAHHPEYPFWRLQNDGIWTVTADAPLTSRQSNSDIPKTELRKHHAVGQFTPSVIACFQRDPELPSVIAQKVLDAHFPDSLHLDILDAVGLSLGTSVLARRPRDAAFRKEVLRVYERRCAICGFDLRIADQTIGLEAAHIKWHQAHGPDEVANGLALCTTHHKLFDLGAFKVDERARLVVSEHVTGTAQFEHVLMRHHMTAIRKPLSPAYEPNVAFFQWHAREVFKEPGRV